MREIFEVAKEIRLRDFLDFAAFLFAMFSWIAALWIIGG